MSVPNGERLRAIKTFPQLVKYLRDELEWPIESDNFEDLSFDFTAEELGIDPASAAKIQEIKQLRPLTTNQPWGIFFVRFEPKRFPIVALRKILSRLVIKKRASANKSERAAWNMHDLLFISAVGEGPERQITLAHFSQAADATDLPALKVIDWDELDTQLKLQDQERLLREKLHWPSNPAVLDAWRRQWASAFVLRPRQIITTAKDLAIRLADLARSIRHKARQVLHIETEQGALRKLYLAFQKALIHDLSEDDFADMYAQTITYGLFSAAVSRTTPDAGTLVLAENLADMVPITNPFLKEMLATFLTVGGRKSKFDFDELGIQEVVELLNSRETNLWAVLRDFGNRGRGEDPVIHFYEDFLHAYDKKRKVQRGVFYTPQPVVSYIVRSVHELLQTEFGLEDGLASTVTWGEMAKRHKDLKIPQSTPSNSPFVTILDPATGTATFLVEVIDVIYWTMKQKWAKAKLSQQEIEAAWNEYVPAHLLPRLYGYELMMAPYAIAHMKIGLKLGETGYRFQSQERARIYLTNALEAPQDVSAYFEQMAPALAHEAKEVNAVKRTRCFTVIIGNPPYSGISANMSVAMIDLVEPYKSINGASLGERKIWAQDDYKKFIRFTQLRVSDSGVGIVGFITNHGFINEPTSRGMRHNLLATFRRVSILDLHGSLKKREVCPDGSPDKNVFDIEPGVAISFLRYGGIAPDGVAHGELWGLRESKYEYLLGHTLRSTTLTSISPSADFYLFVPQSEDTKAEFSQFVSVTDIFQSGSNGIQTSRDHVVYGFTLAECRRIIEEFRLPAKVMSTEELRNKYWPGKKVASYEPGDTRGWRVPDARDQLRRDKDWESKFRRALYRPFDFQTLFYSDYMIDWPRTEVMSQMLRPNLSLCVGRAGSAADNQQWNIVFVANTLVDMNLFYRGGNVNYPLRFAAVSDNLDFDRRPGPNFKAEFLRTLSAALGVPEKGEFDLPQGLTPEDIFNYTYAVFHSPGYRSRYTEFLKIDFPRLALARNLELFRELARLGGELVALHLLESPKLDKRLTTYSGPADPEVEKISYVCNIVWLDKAQTRGFGGVPEAVWNFHIGGYKVCEKWLKDRKGRTLLAKDLAHYQRIVVALHETIRLMSEIDRVIDQYGGWSCAFVTAPQAANPQPS